MNLLFLPKPCLGWDFIPLKLLKFTVYRYKKKKMRRDLEDVQRALGEDGAKGGGQSKLHQTLQMSHFLCFGFLSCLFKSAAVYQSKASVQTQWYGMLKRLNFIHSPLRQTHVMNETNESYLHTTVSRCMM